MSDFILSNTLSLSEARLALLTKAQEECQLIDDKIELIATTNGIALKLYNNDNRPTVYSVEIRVNRYSFAEKFVIDTIINEVKDGHQSLKVVWLPKDASHVINTLKRLSEQGCDGSKDKTLKEYTPMGMLYWEYPVNTEKEAI